MQIWHKLTDKTPEDGAKIVAIASIPSGALTMQYGEKEGDWFTSPMGSMASLSTIAVWRVALDAEIAQFEDRTGWRG
ncbi:MAG: hypothetical protein KAH44_15785 [Oricola sp.]|jgi:hypothetical protein|nr:hypothetical protein [Oricola sp.]